MEFNESTTKVIGVIEKEISDKNNEEVLSAKIKIGGLINEDRSVVKLTGNDLKKLFPPSGYVFEYNFFKNYHFKIGDVLEFWTDENRYAKGNQDKIKIRNYDPELKYFGINARIINGFNQINGITNLNTISLDNENDSTIPFYGITKEHIIGELRVKNGKIEPALYHRIKMWNSDEDNLVNIDGKYRLIQKPQGEYQILDCSDNKYLFEWFRNLLKQIKPDYVDLLDHNRSWRTELPQLFSTIDSEKLEADKIRFKRIQEKFDLLELSRNDIITLVDSSENLKATFEKCLKEHKEEFKDNYLQELAQYKSEIEQQKKVLDDEIKKLQSRKKSEEESLTKFTESVWETKNELTQIKENKNRIIQDFSIIKEVLQGQNTQNNRIKGNTNPYTIEEIIHCESDNINITTIEEFEEQLKYQLSKNLLNPKFAKKIINVISLHNAILVKDIRIGVAIAEATGNAKYIIQQVEPDWLHFCDFWNNGLCEIWNSAHNSSTTFHFLLLENVNMSALECYCRPLLDVINGIRKRIPYGQTSFPANLKIIATIAPFEEPEIGLPLYRDTIENWGVIGFLGNIKEDTEPISKPEDKLLPTSFFLKRNIEEFERINIENEINAELDSIFEV